MRQQNFIGIALLILLLCGKSLHAQNQAIHWYFGHYGKMTFTSSGIDVSNNNSHIYTDEGCSAISDECGNLLYYTDGDTIWNGNHEIMACATGACGTNSLAIDMKGASSATQSGVSILKPGTTDQYYLFTVSDRTTTTPTDRGSQTISYSLIDMAANGGLGEVVDGPHSLGSEFTERILIIKSIDANDNWTGGYWVVTHAHTTYTPDDDYVAWEILPDGTINTAERRSSVPGGVGLYDMYQAGYLKASHNLVEPYIAMAIENYDHVSDASYGYLEICTFDNHSSQASPSTGGKVKNLFAGFEDELPYGLEFSTNNRYLYVAHRYGSRDIHQYDLKSFTGIPYSLTPNPPADGYGALQLGPDGKIYCAKRRTRNISVINNPDLFQVNCSFVDNVVTLPALTTISNSSGSVTVDVEVRDGLPNFATHLITAPEVNFAKEGCNFNWKFTDKTDYTTGNILSREWNFGDGTVVSSNVNSNLVVTHQYSTPGTYTVTMTVEYGCVSNPTEKVVTRQVVAGEGCCDIAASGEFTIIHAENNIIEEPTVWKGKYYVEPEVMVEVRGVKLDLTNVDIVFGNENSGIRFIAANGSGAILRANNSVFRPCDLTATWQGFTFEDNSTGIINECIFKNAVVAVEQYTSTTAIRVTNNLFSNCQTSVSIATTGVATPEAVSGNTFQVDNTNVNWPEAASSYTDYYGIKVLMADMNDLISQNDFAYNPKKIADAGRNNVRFFGIYVLSGSGVISDNNFTNMYRGIDLENVEGFYSVENNEFTITQDENDLNEHYQVRISNPAPAGSQILVFNNSFSNSVSASQALQEAAIYAENVDGLTISTNAIKGFMSGVYLYNVNGLSSIDHNTIEGAKAYGMYVQDCHSVLIDNNIIKMTEETMENPFPAHGIHYRYYSSYYGPLEARMLNNCIYNSRHAIYLETMGNASANEMSFPSNNPIPEIKGNFLYNYYGTGISNYHFRNSGPCGIGCACNPDDAAENTFASNFKGRAGYGVIDIYNALSYPANSAFPVASLLAYGNYFKGTIMVSNVNNNICGNTYYSTSSCGQMVKKVAPLTNAELFRDRILAIYPLVAEGKDYVVQSNFMEKLAEQPEADRLRYLLGAMNVLSANTTTAQLLALSRDAAASGLLAEAQQSWLKYYTAYLQEDMDAARTALAAISPEDVDAQELKYLEGMKLDLMTKVKTIDALTAEDMERLKAIDQRRGAYAATARDMVHAATGGHDYIFRKPEPVKVDKPEGAMGNKALQESCLSVYPNPAREAFSIQYNVDDITNTTMTLVDVQGRTIMSMPLPYNNSVMKVNTGDMAKGVYILSIIRGNEVVATSRIVVE